MNEAKKKNRYSPEYKEKAVARAKELGNVAQAARELKVGYALLQGWMQAAELAAAKGGGLAMALEEKARLRKLENENAELKEELEILKKATAYFARERLVRNTPGSRR